MRCDRFREALSAQLDGEPSGVPSSALDRHLAECPMCAGWADDAARLNRLARMRPDSGSNLPVPDLSGVITADVVLPAARVMRWRLVLRVGLGLAGLAQLVIGLLAVVGESVGMAMSAHATHEAAAWNLAIAAAFVAAAVAPRRASGLVPLLATFMLVLVGLSVRDVADGAVSVSRLLSHLGVLIGLVMLVVTDRLERALPPRWPGVGTPESAAADAPRLRGVA